MNVEHHIASRLATTKEAEALIADDLRRALERAFREGQLAAPSAANPYAPPKPKPAWHDADFIVARYENDDHWQGYLRSGSLWIDSEGQKYTTGVLRDVTPLIEAKVTDEMVERGRDIGVKGRKPDAELVRRVLTAALGLEAG